MKSKNIEDIVYKAIESGELRIDPDGTIWRLAARRADRWGPGTRLIPCAPRRAENNTGSYLQVRVMFNGKRAHALAHRLVWRHFNGPIPDGLTVNHKDGAKKNNRPTNLELATVSEQALHAINVLGYRPEKNLGALALPG